MREKLLTVRETAQYLGVTEGEVIDLTEKGTIPAYKVGGVYLRYTKEQLDTVKHKIKPASQEELTRYSLFEKLGDFMYYNDFYIFSLLFISLLIFLILNFNL